MKISKCFCEIPLAKLVDLVRMRFIEGIGTEELMSRLSSERDREYLATIALFDVKEKDLIHMIDAGDPSRLRHLIDCRAHTREILARHGLPVKEE